MDIVEVFYCVFVVCALGWILIRFIVHSSSGRSLESVCKEADIDTGEVYYYFKVFKKRFHGICGADVIYIKLCKDSISGSNFFAETYKKSNPKKTARAFLNGDQLQLQRITQEHYESVYEELTNK